MEQNSTPVVEKNQQPDVAPATSAPASTSSPPTERMVTLPQSRLDEIIENRVHAERQKLQARIEPANIQQSYAPQPSVDPAYVDKLVTEKLTSHIAQQEEKLRQDHVQRHVAEIIGNFDTKIQAGKNNYPDFDQKFDKLKPKLGQVAGVVGLASNIDNTADVMYHLMGNPLKMASIENLTRLGFMDDAKDEMLKLSQSLKANADARNVRQPREPLTQIQPSPTTVDNGSPSVSDLQQMLLKRRR